MKHDLSKFPWKLYLVKNDKYQKDGPLFWEKDLIKRKYQSVKAFIPSNIETILLKEGLIPDPYFGTNAWKHDLDYNHVFYVTHFPFIKLDNGELVFEGIDTIADIILNGEIIYHAENMLIPHKIKLPELKEDNELIVHIYPTVIEARKHLIMPNESTFFYNYDSMYIRKPPHMFGWDITPRLISAGIFRDAYIHDLGKEYLIKNEIYLFTQNIKKDEALIRLYFNVHVEDDELDQYHLQISFKCEDSLYEFNQRMHHTGGGYEFLLKNPLLWWPKGYGKPNLYDVCIQLTKKGKVIDTYNTKLGIRLVKLERTTFAENGKFQFYVNDMPIFAMGTNWVPVDALHSRDKERIPQILPMLEDLNCNMIRMWGGNIYEDDMVYDYCDEHGILVWQDFAMACGSYPQDEEFQKVMRHEVDVVIKRLRQHASLILWAGNNENDFSYLYPHFNRDPNDVDIICRKLIPEELNKLDFTRPYLPSSPFFDKDAYKNRSKEKAEEHLWGPREYFKEPYYKESKACFASETGYHGCPGVSSLEKFISKENLWTPVDRDYKGLDNDEWLCHATSHEKEDWFIYRINLMSSHVKNLFGETVPFNISDFSKASQISQAEAFKYFIERIRATKWQKTGILWWNLIDGWPEISDAIVDYYFNKKLAYSYVKRSQRPVCLIVEEPENCKSNVIACNDSDKDTDVSFHIYNAKTREEILHGQCHVAAHTNLNIGELFIGDEKEFYMIEWNDDFGRGLNHYCTNTVGIDYKKYTDILKEYNFDKFAL